MKNSKFAHSIILCIMMMGFYTGQAQHHVNMAESDPPSDDPWLVKGNWPVEYPPPTYCYNVDEFFNDFGFGMQIHTAGLLIPGWHPDLYATFVIDFPLLGLTFTESVRITNERFAPVGQNQGYTIYEAYVHYYPDFSAICPIAFAEANYTLMITTLIGTDYVPYPVQEFSGPADIFPAVIFDLSTFEETGTKVFCCGEEGGDSFNQNPSTVKIKPEFSFLEKNTDNPGINEYNMPRLNKSVNVDNWELEVFPNPFQSDIFLEYQLATDGPVMIELRDINGKLVQEYKAYQNKSKQTLNWNLNDLPTGVYVLMIDVDGQRKTKKIIKSAN